MSAPDLSAEVMAQFKESGAEKHTTILLGAGASTTSGLPGWDELVTRLLVKSGAVPDTSTAGLLLGRQDPLIVAEAARAQLEPQWLESVRNELYRLSTPPEASPLHRAAVSHALTGDADDTSLVTLNFDVLLEEALVAEQELGNAPMVSVVSASGNVDEADAIVVHHLHGIVSRDEMTDVVFTLTDFLVVLSDTGSWQRAYMRQALAKGALVIAGTSYRDPDVRQWLHAAKQEAPREHAALVILAREGFGVTRSEFESLQNALESQWAAVGLRPVLVDDHSDAAQVIRELRHVNNRGYLAPRERAAKVWDRHFEQFDVLQKEYARLLAEESETLRSYFSVAALNVSLWLSDGDGGLVRWAAGDRVYRNSASLRRVATGFDTPWIAGRALSADTLLIQDIEGERTRRWRSVAAVPVVVNIEGHPPMSTAVLTVGLPDEVAEYDDSSYLWVDQLGLVADSWSERLSDAVLSDTGLDSPQEERGGDD
ncbi:SIR2 family protein [Microbacterium sp. W4I20]|uniref:SIR2 family protein n=1 Tax=Microbacterium sp. W4I20 TaxID=3042262 RepID=UPI002781DC66|nr:SIR2 family protein [Microbacterium sp. W4I20]MDQ0726701.1 hypothetical protein [Microbacterium sp. W4I20]